MSNNSNNQNSENMSEEQVVEGEQSSALQVETLRTILSTGGLQEQTKPGDSQEVDLSEDVDGDEQDDDYSSSGSDESFTFEVRDKMGFYHTPDTRALELAEKMIGGVHHSHILRDVQRRFQVPCRSRMRTSPRSWQYRWATTEAHKQGVAVPPW